MKSRGGYAYIGIMMLLAFISLAGVKTLEISSNQARRLAEEELIQVGREFERAFASYYKLSPTGSRRYPEKLDELVRDPRFPGVRRHLRRIYLDPITGEGWGLIPAAGGGIMGVFSKSKARPWGFAMPRRGVYSANGNEKSKAPENDMTAMSADVESYSDWKFLYQPIQK